MQVTLRTSHERRRTRTLAGLGAGLSVGGIVGATLGAVLPDVGSLTAAAVGCLLGAGVGAAIGRLLAAQLRVEPFNPFEPVGETSYVGAHAPDADSAAR
jgi:uncharacterized membrane protein